MSIMLIEMKPRWGFVEWLISIETNHAHKHKIPGGDSYQSNHNSSNLINSFDWYIFVVLNHINHNNHSSDN